MRTRPAFRTVCQKSPIRVQPGQDRDRRGHDGKSYDEARAEDARPPFAVCDSAEQDVIDGNLAENPESDESGRRAGDQSRVGHPPAADKRKGRGRCERQHEKMAAEVLRVQKREAHAFARHSMIPFRAVRPGPGERARETVRNGVRFLEHGDFLGQSPCPRRGMPPPPE